MPGGRSNDNVHSDFLCAHHRLSLMDISRIANEMMAGRLWALLPFTLGLLCFYGAFTSKKTGRRKRTIILTIGGLALIVTGWAMWNAI